MKTGRDVVIAALLGAEEYGFSTAPLVVEGCIMMRVCHLDTCPVGVATQNPELRKRFTGTPDLVVSFFEYVAEEVREWLAQLGFRTLAEAIGHTEVLGTDVPLTTRKRRRLDLSSLLMPPPEGVPSDAARPQDHQLAQTLDAQLIEACRPRPGKGPRGARFMADSQFQPCGRHDARLGGDQAFRRRGLPPGTIELELTGSAGQSFGAFLPPGITLRLFGDANDYLGKGLSGGRIIVRPPIEVPTVFSRGQHNRGNVIGYGATSGEIFIRGVVGERFCVRNSGALAVVEGVGDHGCEYMTGGRVVVLGPTGRNFAAGMSGGFAYMYDPNGRLPGRLNHEMVELEATGRRRHGVAGGGAAPLRRRDGLSGMAERLLDNIAVQALSFVKVVPTDYRRALEAARVSEGEPEAVAAIMMAAAHG